MASAVRATGGRVKPNKDKEQRLKEQEGGRRTGGDALHSRRQEGFFHAAAKVLAGAWGGRGEGFLP